MKSIYSAVFGASLLFSGAAMADVQLQLPDEVKVLVVNCVKQERVKQVTLKDGENQLVLRLITEFGPVNDEDMYYSDVFVTRFTAPEGSFSLQIPPMRSEYDIKKFNEEPDIAIIGGQNKQIEIEVAKLEKEGLQIFRDYEEELQTFNQLGSAAAMSCSSVKQVVSEVVPAKKEHVVQKSANNNNAQDNESVAESMDTAEKMLNYWYNQADEETRKRFKDSLK